MYFAFATQAPEKETELCRTSVCLPFVTQVILKKEGAPQRSKLADTAPEPAKPNSTGRGRGHQVSPGGVLKPRSISIVFPQVYNLNLILGASYKPTWKDKHLNYCPVLFQTPRPRRTGEGRRGKQMYGFQHVVLDAIPNQKRNSKTNNGKTFSSSC